MGQVCLVTGGATGLGRAIATRLGEEGGAVAVNYSRSERDAADVVSEVESKGGRAIAVQADVSDPRSVAAMVRSVESSLGAITVLVNNAGTTEYLPFSNLELLTEAHWDRILGVNLVGAFFCAQAVAAGMLESAAGKIINVSSNSAFTAAGSSIPYVVSKSALVSLTQCLARALAPAVQVNAVAPGWMLTRWVETHLPSEEAERIRGGSVPTVPVEDVADVVVALLRNDSITGQVVVIDRGEMRP